MTNVLTSGYFVCYKGVRAVPGASGQRLLSGARLVEKLGRISCYVAVEALASGMLNGDQLMGHF